MKIEVPMHTDTPTVLCTQLQWLQCLNSFSIHAFNVDHFSYLFFFFFHDCDSSSAVLLEWSDIVIRFRGSPLEGGLFMLLVRIL